MTEPSPEADIDTVEFLLGGDPWYCLQERELGLDLYLSGLWAWLPLALGVAAATIFLLAIFHVIPLRSRSIPLLLACGLAAFGIGGTGSYLEASRHLREPGARPPRILVEGRGRQPTHPSHRGGLLAIPFYTGASVLIQGAVCSAFLLVFGGGEKRREPEVDPD